MAPTIPHIRDVANSSSAAGSENNSFSNTDPTLSIVLPLASFAIIFLVLFSTWFWHLWKVGRHETDRKASRDPINRLSSLQNTVPAEKFVLWRQEQCSRMRGSTSFPSDYRCVICLSQILPEDIVRGLPCNHCFHQACLDPWFLREHHRCPICKKEFFIPEE